MILSRLNATLFQKQITLNSFGVFFVVVVINSLLNFISLNYIKKYTHALGHTHTYMTSGGKETVSTKDYV